MSAAAPAVAAPVVVKKKNTQKKTAAKKTTQKFTIDCSEPAADDIFDIASFVRQQQHHTRQKEAGGQRLTRGDWISTADTCSSRFDFFLLLFLLFFSCFLPALHRRSFFMIASRSAARPVFWVRPSPSFASLLS